jgi:hypothetical protein
MAQLNVLTEGARKIYHGRRVGQGWPRQMSQYYIKLGNDHFLPHIQFSATDSVVK